MIQNFCFALTPPHCLSLSFSKAKRRTMLRLRQSNAELPPLYCPDLDSLSSSFALDGLGGSTGFAFLPRRTSLSPFLC